MKIVITNKSIKPKFILQDLNHKNIKEIDLTENETNIDLDLDKFKFAYFKYKNKKTENIILSSNLNTLTFSYNRKRHLYDVSIDSDKKYGKIINELSTDDVFKYRKNKMTTYYFSNNFQNKDVHLIIFFDIQNVFNLKNVGNYTKKNDPYKGWQVEVPIEESGKNFIVFGIENADKFRTSELTPRVSNDNLKDIKEKILPIIDLDKIGTFIIKKINELKEKYDIKDIGIAGASMGGLASYYLGLKYGDIFNYIFTFSPAIGFFKDEWWKDLYNKTNLANKKIFYYMGGGDSLEKRLSFECQNVIPLLIEAGFDENNYYSYVNKSLKHNEIPWRYAFNYAFNEFYNK